MESGLDPYNTAYADSSNSGDRRAERELLWHRTRRNDTVHNNSYAFPTVLRVLSTTTPSPASLAGAVAHRVQTSRGRALDPYLLGVDFADTDLLGEACDHAVGDLLLLGAELLDEFGDRPHLGIARFVVEFLQAFPN